MSAAERAYRAHERRDPRPWPGGLRRLWRSLRLGRRLRSLWCLLTNGKHEFYRTFSATRVYRQCLLCGHETSGWVVDRRDRRPFDIARGRFGR